MKTHLDDDTEVTAIVNNFISYQLSQYGYKWECPLMRQTTKIDYTFRTLGDDFKSTYTSYFSEMCKRLDIKPRTLYTIFMGVANELFSEGIKWIRIVALFVFASELANHCTSKNWPQLIDEVAEALTSYTMSHLLPWVNDHGGWDSSDFISNAVTEFEFKEVEVASPSSNNTESIDSTESQSLIVTSALPASNNWSGEYEFDVIFEEKEINIKSIKDWTYSKLRDKLFVNIGASCPIFIHTNGLPPGKYTIRTMATFSDPEHQMKVVKRCLIHANENDPSNYGHPAPEHLIRCEHATDVFYETDSFTGHHSVVVPYSPTTETADVMYIYRFMCLGSCVGGINRRPVRIIFTLENNGTVLGRRVLEVKICACPGRDKRVEEHQHLAKEAHQRKSKSCNETVLPDPPPKKLKLCTDVDPEDNDDHDSRDDDDDDKLYTLKVYGRETYDLLMKINNALELASLITPDQADVLRKMKQEN